MLDFAVPAYHSLLTGDQTERLERLQKRATKIIYGWDVAYHTVIEKTDLETLEARRERLVVRFAAKAAAHPRFKDEWFKRKEETRPGLRPNEKFVHIRARTERFSRNPLCYMRRKLEETMSERKD